MNKTILGIFPSITDAEIALTRLADLGYPTQDISVIMRENTGKVSDINIVHEEENTTSENVLQGAAGGAATGGTIASLTGLLAGVGAITLPGIGAFFVGGPVAAALGLTGLAATAVSAGITGVLAGGLVGAFIGLGVPEGTAEIYQTRIQDGAILLAAPIRDDIDQARVERIFGDQNAENVELIG